MLCFAKSKTRSYQSKELGGRILEREVAGDLRRMWEEGIFRVVGVVVISIWEKIKVSIYLRPNLLHTRKFVIDLLLLLLPRRSDRSARA